MTVDYDNLHKKWITVHQEYHSPTNQLRKKILHSVVADLVEQGKNKESEFSVLDVGCGTGDYSIHLAEMGLLVTGFDLSQYAIKTVQEKCNDLHITTAHFFVDNVITFDTKVGYDLIVLSEVLEHLDDDMAILKKYVAFLKEGGHILFSVPFDNTLWSFEDVKAGHQRRYDHQSIQSLLDNSHLRTVKSICYGFPLLKLMWLVKIWLLKSGIHKNRPKKKTTLTGLLKIVSWILISIDSHFLATSKGVGIIVLAKK